LFQGPVPSRGGVCRQKPAGSGAPLPESFAAYPTWVAHFWLATLLIGFIVLHVGAALHH
jgi:cytochrome b561